MALFASHPADPHAPDRPLPGRTRLAIPLAIPLAIALAIGLAALALLLFAASEGRDVAGILLVVGGASGMVLIASRRRERDHVTALRRLNADLERMVRERTNEVAATHVQLDTFFESSSDSLFIVRVEDGPRFTYERLNPAGERLTGLSAAQLAGKTPRECLPAATAAAAERHWQRCVRERQPIQYCTTADLPAGRHDWDVVLAPVFGPAADGTGPIIRLVGNARDVTVRHQADEALKLCEARYRLLADHTTDVITCLDLDFTRTYVSPASLAVFGHEPQHMLDQPIATMVHPDDLDETCRRMRRLAAGLAEHERSTNRMRHRDGRWLWIEANLGLVRDEATGLPASIVCSIRDISERKMRDDELRIANAELERLARHLARERDRAELASRAKSRFLAGMSHELRTPLTGLLGYTQLLRAEGGLNAVQQARVHAMLGAGNHLLDMIHRVLDLSEIEEGRGALNNASIDPRALAEACLDLVRPAAAVSGVALSLSMAPDLPRQVVVDATRLRQVLVNLLGNAVKFTARGAIGLSLGRSDDGQRLRIAVVDTGPGIPPGQRGRLFQDFERLDIAATGIVEGAGLGLALSARLATMMGGRLGHEDNPAGGSIFWLELPLTIGATPLPAEPRGAASAAIGRQLRVLIADDVAMNRDIAGAFVLACGHLATCVEGGVEAVHAVAEGDFDVVLMDVLMPRVDGLEAARRIRALPGPRAGVPIVAFTAQAFAEQVEECRAAGMDGHLAKPFTQETLLQTLCDVAYGAREARTEATAGIAAGRGGIVSTAFGPAVVAPAVVAPAVVALNVFDQDAFERTAAMLPPDAIASYVLTIIDRATALLHRLPAPRIPAPRIPGGDALAQALPAGEAQELAEAAHTLAGSAGMLGFQRLAAMSLEFEHAARAATPELATRTGDLRAALQTSLREMRHLAAAAAVTG